MAVSKGSMVVFVLAITNRTKGVCRSVSSQNPASSGTCGGGGGGGGGERVGKGKQNKTKHFCYAG